MTIVCVSVLFELDTKRSKSELSRCEHFGNLYFCLICLHLQNFEHIDIVFGEVKKIQSLNSIESVTPILVFETQCVATSLLKLTNVLFCCMTYCWSLCCSWKFLLLVQSEVQSNSSGCC